MKCRFDIPVSILSFIFAIHFRCTDLTTHVTVRLLISEQIFSHHTILKIITMKTIIHRAETRGGADYGWLITRHTFSFADYYDPARIHFGALRVLNDDTVASGEGFGMHPHDDMEIVTLPLEGSLEHRDSMGNVAVITKGEVQVMTAGTGIRHSEYNYSKDAPVKFLQIWVIPREKGLEPRYSQVKINEPAENSVEEIVSPQKEEHAAWIHQDAWFSLARVSQGKTVVYGLHKEDNGVYLFVLDGKVTVEDEKLYSRDGMGIQDISSFSITGAQDSRVLLMEVPMSL